MINICPTLWYCKHHKRRVILRHYRRTLLVADSEVMNIHEATTADYLSGLHWISYPAPAGIWPFFQIRPNPALAGYDRRI